MHVHCPHCHNPIDVSEDSSLSDISCPSCGSSFSLVDELETLPYDGAETKSIGHFQLVDQLGSGAFATVWKAKDSELDRLVAIKVPRKGQLDSRGSEQFLREARAAAQLQHPNIVSVHEVGREEDTVYIVSDYIEGLTLADWLTGRKPTFREAAELCATVADALHHAHEAGVVHRDLKPENILLDADGEPHVADFGLARREAGEVTITIEGKVLGTPAYMSPEQAKGTAHQADRRSDVYSLGVILFELLTGERPFRGNMRMLLHQVINEEAPSPRKLNGNVPRDLETICLKCLEKEPRRRYGSARGVGDDLGRFLEGRAIEARPVGKAERVWRWCRRSPVVSGLVSAFLVAVVAGVTGITWQWIRAEDEAKENRRLLYLSDMKVAQQAADDNNLGRVEELLKRHMPDNGQDDLRRLEWYFLWRLCDQARRAVTIDQPGRARRIAVSPRKDRLAVGCGNGIVCLWDLRNPTSRQELCRYRIPRSALWETNVPPGWERRCVAFSADGDTLAYPNQDFSGFLLHSLTGEPSHCIDGHKAAIKAVAFSPDGQLAATGDAEGSVKLWALDSRLEKPHSEHSQHTDVIHWLVFSSDSRYLASASADASIIVWDIDTRESFKWEHSRLVWSVAFSPKPDKRLIASGSQDSTVRLWDLATGEKKELLGHSDEIRSVAFSPEGDFLASGSRDNSAILWDLATCTEIASFKGHSHNIESVAFWEDGDSLKLVTGSSDRTVKCWDVDQATRDSLSLDGPVRDLRLSPDGKTLTARALYSHEFILWRIKDGKARPTPIDTSETIMSLAISDEFAAVGTGSGIRLWRSDTLKETRERLQCKVDLAVTALVFSRDGSLLAAGREDGSVLVWNIKTFKRLRDPAGHASRVAALDFTPSGDMLASGSYDGSLKLWEPTTGKLVNAIEASDEDVMCVAFSHDGKTLASGGYDNTVKLWQDLRQRPSPQCRTLVGHSDGVLAVMFSRDGMTLITASGDRTVRAWDTISGQERCVLKKHASSVQDAVLSSDETLLAFGSRDGTIRFLRAATDKQVRAGGWSLNVTAPLSGDTQNGSAMSPHH